jgi:hypothetical protein
MKGYFLATFHRGNGQEAEELKVVISPTPVRFFEYEIVLGERYRGAGK